MFFDSKHQVFKGKKIHLVYFIGDETDYLSLAIKDGGVSLSINIGNGRLDTGIRNRVIRFDDDVWHHVVITRIAEKVTVSDNRRIFHILQLKALLKYRQYNLVIAIQNIKIQFEFQWSKNHHLQHVI